MFLGGENWVVMLALKKELHETCENKMIDGLLFEPISFASFGLGLELFFSSWAWFTAPLFFLLQPKKKQIYNYTILHAIFHCAIHLKKKKEKNKST